MGEPTLQSAQFNIIELNNIVIELRGKIANLEAELFNTQQALAKSEALLASRPAPENTSQKPQIVIQQTYAPKAALKSKRKRKRTAENKNLEEAKFLSDSENSDDSSDSEDETTKTKPPPIIIREKERWPKIQRALNENDIQLRSAVNLSDGVKIYPETVDNFRVITKKLDDSNIQYTTHQLKQDRELIVVIRGVNESYTEDEIFAELQQKFPAVKKVFRMRKGDKIWPLVVVHLDRTSAHAKSIFDLQSLGGLKVKVEPKRKSKFTPQCKRCQKFGHTSNYCHANWVCAFCAKEHATPACQKKDKIEIPPVCANCSGQHRATYRGCSKAPKILNNQSPQHHQTPHIPHPRDKRLANAHPPNSYTQKQ